MLKRFWGTKKTATPEEKLEAAQQDKAEAERLLGEAQEKFDAGQTKENLESLREAKLAFDDACLAVASAERNLKKAQAERAEATRAQQVARTAELRGLVASPAVLEVARPLIERETDLLVQLVEVRIERQALRRKLARLADEGQELARVLELHRLDDHSSLADNPIPVAEALLAHVATLETDDPRRQMLLSIAHELSPSARTPVRNELAEASA